MFEWLFGDKYKKLESKTEQGFNSVKKDIDSVGKWIKHLDDKNKQVFKKLPVLDKQTGVQGVQKSVQTAVQTGNFYDILKGLSPNEKLLTFTLMNSGDMKLSYEDLALLLGKERSTIRGQINAIKQKSEGLIQEISEKNGKKRVYITEEIREKLAKYAKVRVGKGKKVRINKENV